MSTVIQFPRKRPVPPLPQRIGECTQVIIHKDANLLQLAYALHGRGFVVRACGTTIYIDIERNEP